MGKRGKRGGKPQDRSGVNPQAAWDAAMESPRRGMIWLSPLDGRKEMTSAQRLTILRKARWGAANVGLIKRCLSAASRLAGVLTPQADTLDGEWNRAAEDAFWRGAELADSFDESGKLNFDSWQLAQTMGRLRDGDALSVLTESSSGRARLQYYEAHQIENGDDDKAPKNLVDGVYLASSGRHMAYRVVDMSDRKRWKNVERVDAIYHAGEWERPTMVRPPSALAHAISNMVDMIEILADTKHAVKIAALFGVVLTNVEGAGSAQGEALKAFLNSQKAGVEVNGVKQELSLEQIMMGGRMQEFSGGAKPQVLHDARPHPNMLELLRTVVRDICWGIGLAPEIVWEMAGQNGTGTRFLMADTRKWCRAQQAITQSSCARYWVYSLGREMLSGRLRMPRNNVRWWDCRWIASEDPTIDIGREGKLEIEQLAAGTTTLSEVFGKRGKDWETEAKQRLREQKQIQEWKKEMGIFDTTNITNA